VRVAEVFGPTIQGEGPSCGRLAVFVRLSGCNLTCSWCDTPYTWDWLGANGVAYDRAAESIEATLGDVTAAVAAMQSERAMVVITGGEPLVQGSAVVRLCGAFVGRRVEVETNGTLMPPVAMWGQSWVRFNVSPKLANSGVTEAKRWRPEVLDAFGRSRQAAFKFVCTAPSDVDTLARMIEPRDIDPADVWIMPEASDPATLVARTGPLADAAVAHGFNVSSRLHLLAWSGERAR
jgi:7-carboxy-7-deazaguanine synthase